MLLVSLPPGAFAQGGRFGLELPAAVRAQERSMSKVQISLAEGTPLPAWLQFDPARMYFELSGVPDRALPLDLKISAGAWRLPVRITERKD
jgi:hypothetical protein